MVPCGARTYYQTQTFSGGVPAITYSGVPEGTPILFPFEKGRLVWWDPREGGSLLVYDVEGVGTFTVQAAGASTLKSNLINPVAGSVMGYFNGAFEEGETSEFEGYQLYAYARTTERIKIGDQFFLGEPVTLNIQDCLILP
jgi:hypothetical protein